VFSEPDVCKANGCGSGWNEIIVPDSYPFTKINFTQSCGTHDLCYSKCISDCDRYTENKCGEHWKISRKDACDTVFLNDMNASCENSWEWAKGGCKELAIAYFKAVSRYGWSSFYGYAIPPTSPIVARTPQDIIARAVGDYAESGKQSEFIESINNSPLGKTSKWSNLLELKQPKLIVPDAIILERIENRGFLMRENQPIRNLPPEFQNQNFRSDKLKIIEAINQLLKNKEKSAR